MGSAFSSQNTFRETEELTLISFQQELILQCKDTIQFIHILEYIGK